MMEYIKLCVNVFLLYSLIPQAVGSDIFQLFNKCQRRDSTCLTNELQKGITNYAYTGLPEFHLNAFDPLHLPHVESERNTNSPFNVDFIVDNMDIIGLSKSKVIKVGNLDADLKSSILEVDIPKLVIKGGYEVQGNILIFPITGKGKAKITLEECHGKLKIIFKDLSKEDPSYGQIEELKLQLTPKHVTYHLEGLFNDNKELSDAMHDVLKANSLDIYHEISPNIIKAVCITLRNTLNAFFLNNKYNDLLL